MIYAACAVFHTKEITNLTEEDLIAISIVREKFIESVTGSGNHNYGKHLTEETKDKLSASHIGNINNVKYFGIILMNTNEYFLTTGDAFKTYGVSQSSIISCCKGYDYHGYKINYAGKINGEKAKWRFATEQENELKQAIV